MKSLVINTEAINDKAALLYRDVQKAEMELEEAIKYSITLDDLECIRDLQIEIEYRMNLFRQYIESMR